MIRKKLQNRGSVLAQAARKANTLRKVNRDMKDWEALGNSPQRRLSLVQHFKRLKGLQLAPYLD
jgi:hypothetical protein